MIHIEQLRHKDCYRNNLLLMENIKTQQVTCNGSPAAEEDLLGDRVVRGGAELGDHDGQHQVLRDLLALLAVAQLQVGHVREG